MDIVIKILRESTYCLDIKQHFQQGFYDTEESIIEILDFLNVFRQEPGSVKKDAIMVFLNE